MFEETPIPFDQAGDRGLLETNLAALARTSPDLADRVRRASMDGLVFFRSRKGPVSCREADDCLVSKYDPVGELAGVVRKAACEAPELLLVLGAGLGYHLDGLADAVPGTVVCYEPDVRMLRAALSLVDLSAHLGTDRLLVADRVEDIHMSHDIAANARLRMSIGTVAVASTRRRYLSALDDLRHRMETIRRDRDVTLSTYIARSREWFTHMMTSLPRIYPLATIAALENRFRDMPAIVIASGPSLDKNAHLLREAQGRAVLISVGTPMKKLADLGIVPDIAVAIEANDIRYQFEGVALDEVTLVLSLKSHPGLFELPTARTLVFSELEADQLWALSRMGKPPAPIKNGGSVANTAFAIAHRMGVSDLILVGQDLAFGEGGTSHAGGTGTGTDREEYHESIPFDPAHRARLNAAGYELVEGYDGGLVGTRYHWLNYLLWFERRVVEYRADGIRFVNATEGGAKIHGMEQMPLRRVIDEVLPPVVVESPKERLARLCADPPKRPLPELLGLLQRDRQNLKRTRRLASTCASASRRIFDRLNDSKSSDRGINKALAKLKKLEAALSESARPVDPLVSPFTRSEVVVASNVDVGIEPVDERAALRASINQSHLLFKGVCGAAEEVGPMLDSVIERLEEAGAAADVKMPSAIERPAESLAPISANDA